MSTWEAHETRLLNDYLAGIEAADAFVDWAEANDLDPDDPDTQDAYDGWQQDMAEDAAERQAEYRAEAAWDDDRW